jgi:hypothetical protein
MTPEVIRALFAGALHTLAPVVSSTFKKLTPTEIVESAEGISKTGAGKIGEGIPLEQVKPEVLKQIHFDKNGAYGYLPNKGTAYDRPEYDFTKKE